MATTFATVVALLPFLAVASSTGVRLDGGEVPLDTFVMKVVWIQDKKFSEKYSSDKFEELRKKAEDMINQNIPENKKVLALETAHFVNTTLILQPKKLWSTSTKNYIRDLNKNLGPLDGFTYIVLTSAKEIDNKYESRVNQACNEDASYRVIIVIYSGDDGITLKFMVRGIAALLGIYKDYNWLTGYSTARNGQSCRNRQGIRDKESIMGTKWSPCSQDYFIDRYKEGKLDCLAGCAQFD